MKSAQDGRDEKSPQIGDVYPLTPVQAGMLYHTLSSPDSGVYIVQYTCEIGGPFDPERFREAWKHAFERHAALRTVFVWEGLEQPLQAVRGDIDLPWRESDWTGVPSSIQSDRLEALLREDRTRGFALDLAPLVRLSLIRIGPNVWRFVWTFHHIVVDGWSAVTLLQEVFRETADPSAVIATPEPYRNFITWLTEQDPEASRVYWERRLDGIDRATSLSLGPPDAVVPTAPDRQRHHIQLGETETSALQEFASRHQLTMNTVVHGAWALALSRYSGETDVVYGTAVSGRPSSLPGVESMTGMFINSLPVRAQVAEEAEPIPWLQHLQRELFDLRRHEHTALPSIAEWTGVGTGRGSFESVLVFESSPLGNRGPADGTELQVTAVRYIDQSNYPFALLVFPGPSMALTAVFDPQVFAGDLVDRLLSSIVATLTAFSSGAASTLGALPPPGPEERSRLLQRAGEDSDDPVEATDVMVRFLAQVEARPDALAIVTQDVSWTYADLAARVESTSAQLQTHGATAGSCVALALDRSPAAVRAMLAVLNIGGTYLPIAADEPTSRRRFLLEDANASFMLTDRSDDVTNVPDDVRVLEINDEAPANDPAGSKSVKEQFDALAYILYTSGSTGRPKGVCVSRRSLAYSTGARDQVYESHPDAFLLLSPITFDSSVAGIFWTLCTGGTLVVPAPGQEREPTVLAELIRRHAVTHTLCVPALWALMIEQADESSLGSLSTVILAGETCASAVVRRHFTRLPEAALYNEYGPTETTVWATVSRVPQAFEEGPVSLGRPIPGTRVYLLDATGRLVPDGAAGEICVSGPGVTRGYLNGEDLTASRFVADSFSADPNSRLYRTGDLGRWSKDDGLTFLGRRDEQVKIRGRRIELGEIEDAVLSLPDVREAVIVFHEQLIAFVVPEATREISDRELRARLASDLPSYMVPARVVSLESLPRGRNGKIDRARLPLPSMEDGRVIERVAPSTPTEERLVALWRDVLDLDSIGIDDHFFEVGGHSLLAIRLLGAIRDEFAVDFPFEEFFSTPTIAGSARRIETLTAVAQDRELDEDGAMEEFEI